MWRRFQRKPSSSTPTDPEPFNKSGPFTPDHPFMNGWPALSIASILSDTNPDFSKFRAWMANHPDTQSHFLLRQIIPGPVDTEFRCYALKSQIIEGFTLLAGCDKIIQNATSVTVSAIPEHPFPAGRKFTNVSKQWRMLLIQYAVLEDLKNTSENVRERVVSVIMPEKIVISSILSLVASIDGIPPQYQIVVDFSTFNLDSPEVMADLRLLQWYRSHAMWLNQVILQVRAHIKELENLSLANDDRDVLEGQMDWLCSFVERMAASLDDRRHCLPEGYPCFEFLDFFMHPNSLGKPIMTHFFTAQKSDPVRFRDLTRTIVTQFSFTEPTKATVIAALVSALVGPMFLPDIPIDGIGTDSNEVIGIALLLLSRTDPIHIVEDIAELVPADPHAAVGRAREALSTLTSSADAVLLFAYQFTSPAYLTQRANAVRAAIGGILGLEE
jgi:hypothetical protein